MRLNILDHGQQPLAQIFLNIFAAVTGFRPGPMALNSYRRELFGKHFSACIQDAMRRESAWQKSELELFGAFVSSQLACRF